MSITGLDSNLLNTLLPPNEVKAGFRAKLIDVLQHDTEFPTFPTVLAKLQACLSHPDTGFDKISSLVKLDPGMTARIFSLVRSAAYGGTKVSSLEEALWRLGLKEVRTIILTTKFMTPFAHLKIKADWKKFWLHSLFTARLTYYISDLFQPVGDKEYLAGLLHDSGKLILAHYFPQQFETIFQKTLNTDKRMFEVEREILGTDHSAIGAILCHKWGLNQDIIQSIQDHHQPQKIPAQQFLPQCLYIANSFANQFADNIDQNETTATTPPEDITQTPEWQHLSSFSPRRMINLSLSEERNKARDTVETMLTEKNKKSESTPIQKPL